LPEEEDGRGEEEEASEDAEGEEAAGEEAGEDSSGEEAGEAGEEAGEDSPGEWAEARRRAQESPSDRKGQIRTEKVSYYMSDLDAISCWSRSRRDH